ncbi:unnamed protein product [Heligmosomoides polygyrus]|uniref:Palmitoyltransferase n=1 Tax=Heligmosomoides polygyrus TaxID=6339 RepID=A0A183FAL1_HELPZ|nr:unnamed protein product [Heligmosomoides polygyrus]
MEIILHYISLLYTNLVSLSDPGVIERNEGSHKEFVESIERYERVNYCFTCWVDKPQGAKHCSVCDRCVKDFDHHCPWLHQCITIRNLRLFMVFVACVSISAAIYTGGCVLFFVAEHHSWLMFTLIIAFFHAVMLAALFFNQCIQVCPVHS